jgi:lysophospholipase L1-like esterase
MSTLVALGDSVTEGVGDPGRGGLHGWIHYLTADPDAATGLTLTANLARTGDTVARLRRRQLDRAVALAPDVYTCVVGVNDVVSRHFDPAAFEHDYALVVGALAGSASRGVLTMTLHDIGVGLPLPPDKRAALRRRTAQANVAIEGVSERYGAWVLDARAVGRLDRLGMLSIDRLHPNSRGHRYLAASALDVLREHGAVGPDTPPAVIPPADPIGRRIAADARHLRWLGRHLALSLIEARRTRHAR